MFELFGHSYSIFWTLGLIVILFGIIARLVWWAGKRMGKLWYFPDEWLCTKVRENLSRWAKKAKELVTYKPSITARGFFLTPIWICIIGLNVLLLGQVLEVFFSGGKRLPLPWVGAYAVFPLILGILYAVSETVLGVVRDAFKNKSLRVLLVLLLVSMFVAEAGLAYYRAWLLTSGEEMISPTMWDNVILKAGPFLAAGIAFAVASVETLAGYFSFREFIEPIVPALLRWFGGVMMGIWCALAYWLFGFRQKDIPTIPPTLPALEKGSNALETRIQRLERGILELHNRYLNLPPPPTPVERLEEAWEAFLKENSIAVLMDNLKEQTGQLSQEIERIKKFKHLPSVKIQLNALNKKLEMDMAEMQTKAYLHRDNVHKDPRIFDVRHESIRWFNTNLNNVRSEHGELMVHYNGTQTSLRSEKDLLPSFAQEGYSLPACNKIINTVTDRLINAKGCLEKIGGSLENLHELQTETLEKDRYDALETRILFFLTNNIPTIKDNQHMQMLRHNYKSKRFHLMLPWNWFSGNGNGDHKSQPPDAPPDKQNEVPEREEAAR